MIEAIQLKVDEIRRDKFSGESSTDLVFDVVLLFEENDNHNYNHKILLVINHHGTKLAATVFPKISHYEYDTLEEEMESLFNATM